MRPPGPAGPPPAPPAIPTRAGPLDFSAGPLLMGVLNVTPDSFSDGGRYGTVASALARAEAMAEAGAALIDVGGESTRPGAAPVSLEEELRRVVPVVEVLAERLPHLPISVDTSKAEVARQSLEAGASVVNDVSALEDPAMPGVVRAHGVPVVLMHRRGDPRTMQDRPAYHDVVQEVKAFLSERRAFAAAQGIAHVILDPGLGFGKTTAHNLEILRRVNAFRDLGSPLLIGASQKSFIGRLLGGEATPLPPAERAEGSLAVHLWAAHRGAHLLRVHDVRGTARALALWRAMDRP